MSGTHTLSRNKQIGSLLLGPLLCLLILHCPVPAGLPPQGMRHLAAAAWVLCWWVTSLFPLAAVSLMSVVIYGVVDVMPPAAAYAIFGNPNLMLMLGAMLILGAWKESGLISRYAYWALNLSFVQGRPRRLMLVFALAVGLVSTIVPNIPVAILFVSIAVAIGRGLGAKPGDNFIRSLSVMSGVGSALGGAGTPIGGAPNLVVIGVIATTLHYNVQFMEWTAIGLPMAILMLLAMCGLALLLFPLGRSGEDMGASSTYLRDKLRELGPVTRFEHIAMLVMALAMLLWVGGQPLARFLGWQAGVKLFAAPSVALLMGVSLMLAPLGRDRETGRLHFAMSWGQCVRSVDWSIIIFVGGALLFGDMLVKGGVDKWLGGLISGALGDVPPLLVWLILMLIGGVLAQIIVNLAVVGLFIPITASLALHYGLHPVVTCLTVGIICNIGIMFPFSSVPIAAAMQGSEGYSRPRDYILYGLLVLVACSIIALALGTVLGDAVFGPYAPPAGA